MRFLAIIGLCVAAAVIYGIVHDQVTARVCVEYFTIGHPPVFGTEDPTLLGIGWGIIATWWVGLVLGIPLAFAAQAGSRPERSLLSLIHPVVGLMIVAGICALVAGVVGWVLAREGAIFLVGDLASEVPRNRHAVFLADGFAHTTSYVAGFVGGVVVIVRVWLSRRRKSV